MCNLQHFVGHICIEFMPHVNDADVVDPHTRFPFMDRKCCETIDENISIEA